MTICAQILLANGEPVDVFWFRVHRAKGTASGREMSEKLKDLLPKQLFKVVIKAAIGGNIIARETF